MIGLPSRRDDEDVNPYRAPAPVIEPERADAAPELQERRERYAHRETTIRALALVKLWTTLGAATALAMVSEQVVRPEYLLVARVVASAIALASLVAAWRMWNLMPEAPYVQTALSLATALGFIALGGEFAVRVFLPGHSIMFAVAAVTLLHGQIAFVGSRLATLRVCSPRYWEAVAATPDYPIAAAIALKFFGWSVLWWLSLGLALLLAPFDGN